MKIPATIPKTVLSSISQEAAVFYKLIPFAKDKNTLKVGMVNPDDVNALEAVKLIGQHQGLKTEVYKISEEEFQKATKQYSSLSAEVKQALSALERELEEETGKPLIQRKSSFVQEAPITKMVAVILRHAVEGNSSDIHIEPGEKDIRVRFRVDGILHSSLLMPKKVHLAIISRIKILANLKIDETRKPQDGRFRATVNNKQIDFRVSSLPTNHGEKVVMRLLDTSSTLLELTDLGLRHQGLEVVTRTLKKTSGMILVTGPTGSGKTTTLYAILKILNKEAVNIVTLEDPIEYWIEGVSQSQIRPDIGYTFASGLRSLLRQDPDIIMVGEIRDNETAELAVHAALTGHIVLSTLHTNNAIGAIPRLIDMQVEPFLLTSALNVIVAQRLARRISKKESPRIAPQEIQDLFKKELGPLASQHNIKYPVQLPGAKKSQGRIGIFEVMEMTPQLENLIMHKPTEDELKQEAERQGMVTMMQDGLIKAAQGEITVEELLRVTEN